MAALIINSNVTGNDIEQLAGLLIRRETADMRKICCLKGVSEMRMKQRSQLLCLCCLIAAVLLFPGFVNFAQAEAPMVKTQSPGYYRMMIGQFEVTAIADGFFDMDQKLLSKVTEAQIKKQLERNFAGYPKVKTPNNVYIINTGAKLVLVDAGGGSVFGPAIGHLLRNMKAAGYGPSQVDAILVTHMHRDHIGGLIDSEGKAVFPKAIIYVDKSESDFWLSEETEAGASSDNKKYFKMAREVAMPYIADGRWKTFSGSSLPLEGISAVDIAGHTPGHTAFLVTSKGEEFLIIGDMIHSAAVQFAMPGSAITFDIDQKKAVAVRKTLFKKATGSRTLIGGMHIAFPGIGHIRAEGKDSYSWIPIDFAPMP
jgi:glyoxylase-like metal-dependent hydrolase (beta-lactamase superfamily II)